MTTMSAESPIRTVSVVTAHQGTLDVRDSEILRFTSPLLGFPECSRYILHQAKPGPLWWLQSTERPDVAFCVVQPASLGLDPDYEIDADEVMDLGTTEPSELAIWTIVVLHTDPRQSRTNLRAPVLICKRTGRAKQVVLNDGRLPLRQPLLPPASAPPASAPPAPGAS
jgi:flagellar assembly factor FliW